MAPEAAGGAGIVLSKRESRARVGLNLKIWQLTYAVPDLETAISHYSDLFGLGDMYTYRYASELYGYDGAITWFDTRRDGLMDSLEYLDPTDPEKAAGRFQRKAGQGIYMASIETDALPAIRERVTRAGPGWDGQDDVLGFIHPLRLHGLLLGLVDSEAWHARRELPDGA